MGAIKFRISEQLLKDVFGFPDEIKFCSAAIVDHFQQRTLDVVVIGPDFPEVEFGSDPPLATPTYRTETQRIYKLDDWGLPKEGA